MADVEENRADNAEKDSSQESEEDEEARQKTKEDEELKVLDRIKGNGEESGFTKNDIKHYAKILTENQGKDARAMTENEVKFITKRFKQRFCKHFCSSRYPNNYLKKNNPVYSRYDRCKCGLAKYRHRHEAIENEKERLAKLSEQEPSVKEDAIEDSENETESFTGPIDTKSPVTSTENQTETTTADSEVEKLESANEETSGEQTPKPEDQKTEAASDTASESSEASTKSDFEWNTSDCTGTEPSWNFGNVKMYAYEAKLTYTGTSKFLRMDDNTEKECGKALFDLLVEHWKLPEPNLVISVSGGDVDLMTENMKLKGSFKDGIMKTAATMEPWFITDGLYEGSTREISGILGKDFKESKQLGDRKISKIHFIGIAPWGYIFDEHELMGLYVGSNEATYTSYECYSYEERRFLDPYHTAQILADDGTYEQYDHEPKTREKLEDQFRDKLFVFLIVGGDKFTLRKAAKTLESNSPIVIVNNSGYIANMLADVLREAKLERNAESNDTKTKDMIAKKISHMKDNETPLGDDPEEHLEVIIEKRKLVTVFGMEPNEENDLNTAILSALCDGALGLWNKISLTLVMDRADVAKECLYNESNSGTTDCESIEKMLYVALVFNKPEFLQMLLDDNLSIDVDWMSFLTKSILISFYNILFKPEAKSESIDELKINFQSFRAEEEKTGSNVLPQAGRLIHSLLGNNYRLLYQENHFRNIDDEVEGQDPIVRRKKKLCQNEREEAIWHIFFWTVLHNYKDMAEILINECSCKIGASLIACKMLKELGKVAETWHEAELTEDLNMNSQYFEELAFKTIDCMYKKDRTAAYSSLVTVLPIDLGANITPLFIADDAECMKFMGHACCQTLLDLIWTHNMVPGTPLWKLIPIFPFNIFWIEFDGNDLYGMYKGKQKNERGEIPTSDDTDKQTTQDKDGNDQATQNADSRGVSPVKTKLYSEWDRIRDYYTAPVNKYIHGLLTYVVFLGLFSHMLLSELKPMKSVEEISVYEWLVYIWVASITLQELQQFLSNDSSGPLHNIMVEREWRQTWSLLEIIYYVARLYRFPIWISGRWNIIDAIMILLFIVSTILRFTLPDIDFGLVRFCFSATLIFFYLRLLRLGYIFKALGPRIITIRAMVADLIQFFIVLSVFLVSFGIAFQSILEPRASPSQHLFVDILWRPYWQMYGELFIGEDGLGRDIDEKSCYGNRTRAEEENSEVCYDWLATLLLAVFMLITNIMLLNLLIAIFSHSFEIIESESQLIWRYHLYDLVHEYYETQWLPPPLNLFCIFANFLVWCQRKIRRKAYLSAQRTYWERAFFAGAETGLSVTYDMSKKTLESVTNEARELMEADFWYKKNFYLTDAKYEEFLTNHFRLPAVERDTELEDWAYKKHRQKVDNQITMESKVDNSLNNMLTRMQDIRSDLSEFRQQKQAGSDQSPAEQLPAESKKDELQKRPGQTISVMHSSLTEPGADKVIPINSTENVLKQLDQIKHSISSLNDKLKDNHTLSDEIKALDERMQEFYKQQKLEFEPVLKYVNRRAKRREEIKQEAEKSEKETK